MSIKTEILFKRNSHQCCYKFYSPKYITLLFLLSSVKEFFYQEFMCMSMWSGLPQWLSGKESTCSAGGDADLLPGWGRSPGWDMVTHSSILAGRIPWTEKPVWLQSIGSQRVGHDWSDWACTYICEVWTLWRTEKVCFSKKVFSFVSGI